jgi:hypothetical protein
VIDPRTVIDVDLSVFQRLIDRHMGMPEHNHINVLLLILQVLKLRLREEIAPIQSPRNSGHEIYFFADLVELLPFIPGALNVF